MPLENKKQIFIIGGALLAGVIAVFLASNYIKGSIQSQTASLAEQYGAKEKDMVAKIQQKTEQQMAALAQELERVKGEEAAALQKQMALVQQAQAQAARQRPQEMVIKKVRKPSLALKTPLGKRAVTVMIDSLAAVGGLINAGDFVDVIAQLNVTTLDADKKTVTAVIFQDLQVLAVNTNLDDPGAYDDQQALSTLKITFAVDPQEAGLLAFANKNGSLELALRSPDEAQRQKVKANTWKTLTDYVLKNQGLNIQDPDGTSVGGKSPESKPNIQIFRAGKEL